MPSKGSTHHVGASSIKYSREEPAEYVSSPMNLANGQPAISPSCLSPDILVVWVLSRDGSVDELFNLCNLVSGRKPGSHTECRACLYPSW